MVYDHAQPYSSSGILVLTAAEPFDELLAAFAFHLLRLELHVQRLRVAWFQRHHEQVDAADVGAFFRLSVDATSS